MARKRKEWRCPRLVMVGRRAQWSASKARRRRGVFHSQVLQQLDRRRQYLLDSGRLDLLRAEGLEARP